VKPNFLLLFCSKSPTHKVLYCRHRETHKLIVSLVSILTANLHVEKILKRIKTLISIVDVALLSNLIFGMKQRKAAYLDGQSCEHLMYCHPAIIVIILPKLFNLFIELGHVTHGFGASYSEPIPKCDCRTRALSVDDFTGLILYCKQLDACIGLFHAYSIM
jgi:hypothetical protein